MQDGAAAGAVLSPLSQPHGNDRAAARGSAGNVADDGNGKVRRPRKRSLSSSIGNDENNGNGNGHSQSKRNCTGQQKSVDEEEGIRSFANPNPLPFI